MIRDESYFIHRSQHSRDHQPRSTPVSDSESTPPPPPPSTPMNNPFEGLDVNKIKNAGLPTKLMLGGSVAFFIFAFLDWWSVSSGPYSVSGNAFDNFRGTFAWIMMIAVGVLAVLLLVKGSNKNFVTAALACAGLSALFTLWFWAAIPDSGISQVDTSASFGLFLSLIAAIVATAGAFMTFQASQQTS